MLVFDIAPAHAQDTVNTCQIVMGLTIFHILKELLADITLQRDKTYVRFATGILFTCGFKVKWTPQYHTRTKALILERRIGLPSASSR